jgi:DNA repair protein RadC
MQPNLFNSNLAEIQVTYKAKVKFSDMRKITTSKNAEEIFRIIWSDCMELREEFYILLLNRANRVLGWYRISEGGASGTVVDAKLIFSVALKCNACGIILAHNHPSGNTKPSEADGSLTKRIVDGGKLLEISVFDHLILTTDYYLSFADEGWL